AAVRARRGRRRPRGVEGLSARQIATEIATGLGRLRRKPCYWAVHRHDDHPDVLDRPLSAPVGEAGPDARATAIHPPGKLTTHLTSPFGCVGVASMLLPGRVTARHPCVPS